MLSWNILFVESRRQLEIVGMPFSNDAFLSFVIPPQVLQKKKRDSCQS